MKCVYLILLAVLAISCGNENPCDECTESSAVDSTATVDQNTVEVEKITDTPTLVVLGTTQDAGSPHINCQKACCAQLHDNPGLNRKVVSLGLIDPQNGLKYIFESTPDFPSQLHILQKYLDLERDDVPDGIFLTHAHIGHYTGLMHLGKEATNAKNVPVYAMPKMYDFLKTNGPWSQLVTDENIELFQIFNESKVMLSQELYVTPFLVPHRDEYSETVGYRITGPSKTALFIPDIDKWEKWDKDICTLIKAVDYAFLDATFYDENELESRNMSDIPHPFVVESVQLFEQLDEKDKSKVIFIHFNHSNPLLLDESESSKLILESGFKLARIGQTYPL